MPFYCMASPLFLLGEIDGITRALRESYVGSGVAGETRVDIQRGLNIVR